MNAHTKESQAAMTPQTSLQALKDGNERFINATQVARDLNAQVAATSTGQYPFATVLHCIDSRVSAEHVFDQGIGDLFSIRIAGNFVNEDILGSMEFGCKVAGSKIIVVLGHTKCGAVKGACDHVEMGNLTALLTKIRPAVDDEIQTKENRNSSNSVFVENVAAINVNRSVTSIMERSPILKEMIESGQIGIVGGTHDITTGEVTFYTETMNSVLH